MRLYIDSGTHSITNEKERIDAIDAYLSSPTAVFTEDSPTTVTWKEKLIHLPVAPLLIGTMVLWADMILPILRLFFGDDTNIETYLVEEYSVVKIPTDLSMLDIISDEVRLHVAANWLPVAIFCYAWLRLEHPTITLVTLPLVTGLALFFTFLAVVHNARNNQIAHEIKRHAEDHEEACLVTGTGHHKPVADRLAMVDEITVLNPTPKENSTVDKSA